MARIRLRILVILTLAAVLAGKLPVYRLRAIAQEATYPPGYDQNLPRGYSQPNVTDANNPFSADNYGPSSPTPPTSPERPASWPGGAPQQPPAAAVAGAPPLDGYRGPPGPAGLPLPYKDPTEPPYEPAAILAHVGSEVIQAAEILPMVRQRIDAFVQQEQVAAQFNKLPEEVKQEQMRRWEREVVEGTLKDSINVKLVMCDVRSNAPAEGVEKNLKRIREEFNNHELNLLRERYKAVSIADLENKLRAQGGSLESQRIAWVERYMAVGWLNSQVRSRKEPSHEQMVNYYQEHIAEWQHPARARWEQLTARFREFPSKADAWRAIAQWGRHVQAGAPLAEVAKAHSHGISADEGGQHDWTTQGSLLSEAIDHALFTLPVGTLSQIFEDEEGFHIVRVLEREEHRTTPFGEVQSEIKKKLQDGDAQSLRDEYIAKLRERTPVHTIFDQANEVAGRPADPAR